MEETVEQQFINYCRNGELELAQVVFNSNPNVACNVCNNAFFVACLSGHLNVAQWLYTVKQSFACWTIMCAFSAACRSSHLHIVQWLHGVYSSIISYNDAFYCACDDGNYDIAQWLLFFVPNVNIAVVTQNMQAKLNESSLLYCLHHKNINMLML